MATHQCSGLKDSDEREALAILGRPRRSFHPKYNRALFADASAEDALLLRGLHLGAGLLLGAAVASAVVAFTRKGNKRRERR